MAGRDLFAPQQAAGRNIFAAKTTQRGITDAPIRDVPIPDDNRGLVSDVAEGLESFGQAADTIISSAIAEPIAGIAGIVGGILPGEFGQGERFIEATREALTIQPKTEAGKAGLKAVGEVLAPVGEAFETAETFLGDKTFEATGSPALAAAAVAIPTLATEILGIASAKGALKTTQAIKKSRAEGKIARSIEEALPTQEQLKDTSRAIFKEIDDTGAVLKAGPVSNLINRLDRIGQNLGIDQSITPKSAQALKRFKEVSGNELSLGELDILRTVSQNAAKSLEVPESAIGSAFIETIDEFLDSATPRSFERAGPKADEVGKKFRIARNLWGRARRSELIDEAFTKADLQASGFENGIRTQFRQILSNKKKRRFFNKEEVSAMNRVVKGTGKENLAKLIGRLGFSEGGATNILGATAGIAGGAAVGGPIGAVTIPFIGQVSRKLAQRMTKGNAVFVDQVIRAGSDANKIARAYIKNTPKAERSAVELSELLMKPSIDLKGLKGDELLKDAVQLAAKNKAELAGAATATTGLTALEGNQ